MKRDPKDDTFDWFGALKRSADQARALRPAPALHPVVECHCGALEDRGRPIGEVVDLTDADVTIVRNQGVRPCRACPHGIHVGQMCVLRFYSATSTVRDHYHQGCVKL